MLFDSALKYNRNKIMTIKAGHHLVNSLYSHDINLVLL